MNELSNWIPDSKIIAPKEVDRKLFAGPRRTPPFKSVRRVIPAANHNSEALSVVIARLASTGRAFQLQQAFEPATYLPPTVQMRSRYPVATQLEALSKPLAVFFNVFLNLDRQRSPDRRLRKIFPPTAHVPPHGVLFLVRGAAAPIPPEWLTSTDEQQADQGTHEDQPRT